MKIIPIGIIRSPFKSKSKAPIQPVKSKDRGRVEVFKKYEKGLEDLEGFSHIILIYYFHKSRGYELKVKPFQDTVLRGVFATRINRRPNQIGISVVKLLRRKGNILYIDNIDALDGTPLLDIKPYIPEFEPAGRFRTGWRKNINK